MAQICAHGYLKAEAEESRLQGLPAQLIEILSIFKAFLKSCGAVEACLLSSVEVLGSLPRAVGSVP